METSDQSSVTPAQLGLRVNPLTLQFPDPDVELRFRDYHARSRVTQTRLAAVLIIVLFAVFAIIDQFIKPHNMETIWVVRLAVIAFYTGALIYSFSQSFLRHFYRTINACIVVAAAALLFFTTQLHDESQLLIYYTWIVLAMIGTFGFSGNSFRNSLILVIIMLAAFNAVVALQYEADLELTIITNVFMVSAGIIAGITGYYLERHERALYYQLCKTDAARAASEHRAHHDPLTGVPNRELFFARLESAIIRASTRNIQTAILFIDMNDFKPINDAYGHQVGDHVIREIALRLQGAVRRSDTVARYGGDEFLILLEELENEAAVDTIIASISRRLNKGYYPPGTSEELTISASIGVAYWPKDGETAQELLSFADAHMYEAKRQNKSGETPYAN